VPVNERHPAGAGTSDKSKVAVLVVRGTRHVVRAAVLRNGSSPATEFYESLEDRFRDAYLIRLRRFAHTGKLLAPHQLNALEDGLFEFKLSEGPRLIAYHAGRRERGLVILTHRFIKKSAKTPKGEIERARSIRDEIEGT
jgi:phage-related protein